MPRRFHEVAMRMDGICICNLRSTDQTSSLFASGTNTELHLLQPWLVDFVDSFTIQDMWNRHF